MERDLNGVIVRQSTKTSCFNATDLMNIYNAGSSITQKQKQIQDYMANKSTKEYIAAIQADILNVQNSGVLESPLVHYAKRGKYGGTWMHPYLFIDFAMWLSPEFKLTCVKWIYDKLIEVRINSGDTFKEVNRALTFDNTVKIQQSIYINEANMINKLAFGKADGGQRNHAKEDQLRMLTQLQRADVALIKKGLDYYERYDALKKIKNTLLICQ